jgi:protein SCO1/2
MKEIFRAYRKFFILIALLSAFIMFLFYRALTPKKTLPIYSPADVNPELVDSLVEHIKINHKIADWEFTNQNGKKVSHKDYEGKIYVADFFFTTCPTICPIMTDNMVWLQDQIKNFPDVMLLSHSVMPDIDTPEVLKKYALEKGVNDKVWNLVTGDKKDIFYIARQSYLAVKTGSPDELYDMVHTENFILVDQKRRIRGFYDGTKQKDMEKLLEDISFLVTNEKP